MQKPRSNRSIQSTLPYSMCLPGIIDSEILSGIFSASSCCLYSFSNKQTSLKKQTTPITLPDCIQEARDHRFYQWTWAACACRQSNSLQPGLSLPSQCHLALLRVTLAQDVVCWSQDRACSAICHASTSWAAFWPSARHWTPTLSLSLLLKAIKDSAKLLITFWKKAVVKKCSFK